MTIEQAPKATSKEPLPSPSPYRRRRPDRNKEVSEPAPAAAKSTPPTVLITLFVLSLLIPIRFSIGSVELTPYRVSLLFLFAPSVFSLFSGRLGRILVTDIFIVLACLWGAVALFVAHGVDAAIEPAGILLIETFGAYLAGRYLIRDETAFRFLVQLMFILTLVLLPLAVAEAVTRRPFMIDLLQPLFRTMAVGNQELRMGLRRAQVVFEHPILFGAFISSFAGILYYSVRQTTSGGSPVRLLLVSIASFLSLSSGALAALAVQYILILWDKATRSMPRRWAVFGGLCVGLYAAVDLVSTRSPFHVIVSYLTFSSGSSYNRILIWQFGSAEVWRHPLFGIGLGDWQRPSWMSSSMDNFWLVVAVRYGLPAFLLLAAAVVALIWELGRASSAALQGSVSRYRSGLLVSLGGMILGACTVHYWNATYCWFLFLIGCGPWMVNLPRRAIVQGTAPS